MSSVSVITFTASLPRTLSSSHLRPPRIRAQTEENLRLTFWRSYSGWSKFVKLHVRDFALSWHVPTILDETTWLASRLLRGSLSVQSSCLHWMSHDSFSALRNDSFYQYLYVFPWSVCILLRMNCQALYYWHFTSSWNQIGALHWKWIPVPINRHIETLLYFILSVCKFGATQVR